MSKKIKPLTGTCIYCGKVLTWPEAGAEYVKTRRKDILLFHTQCFAKAREENNKWM